MEGSPQAGRKEIVAALTGVLKNSPLKDEIDPKAFFMMVSGNFQVLFQNGTLDLGPIWAALAAEHKPEFLSGIFLKFEEAVAPLGLGVRQPDPVRSLSSDEREEALAAYALVPETLPMEALAPAIPAEMRQSIVSAVALAVRASPIGPYISSTQLQFVVGNRLDELYDDGNLDFGPIRDMLLEVEGTDQSATFNVFLRLCQQLERAGVTVKPADFKLSEERMAEVELEVLENPTSALYDSVAELQEAPRPVARPSDLPRPKNVEEKLRKYGLQGVRPEPKVRIGSIILALLVLVSGGGLIYLFQPSRSIDHAPYDAILPLTGARIFEGRFLGSLDVPRWRKLTVEQRQKALDALGEKLAAEKKLRTAAVVNEKGSLCMFPTQDGKLGIDLQYLYLGTELEQKYTDRAKLKQK